MTFFRRVFNGILALGVSVDPFSSRVHPSSPVFIRSIVQTIYFQVESYVCVANSASLVRPSAVLSNLISIACVGFPTIGTVML